MKMEAELTLTEESSRELFKLLEEQDKIFMEALLNGECGFTLKCSDGRSVELVPQHRQEGWIPCSERLPKEGETVLVCMKMTGHKYEWEEQRTIEFGRISSDRYDAEGTGWEWLNESGADYWEADWNDCIIAWMPLPKPYKGKEPIYTSGKEQVIAAKIKLFRKAAGLTQSELAEEVSKYLNESNISQTLISKYEKGQAVPPLDKVAALSKALGVSAAALLNVEETGGIVMARHNMCMRLKSGREFRFSCEEYTIKTYSMTHELAGVEFKNVSGECPKFFKTDDIESISEYIEDEGAIAEEEQDEDAACRI